MVHLAATVYPSTLTANSSHDVCIYKNGASLVNRRFNSAFTHEGSVITCDDVANGTDYYECWVYITGGGTVDGVLGFTHFSGHIVGGPPGAAGAAGPVGPPAPSWALVSNGFCARKVTPGTQAIAAATFTKIAFDFEDYDSGNYYDATLSRWTPPAGIVHIDVGAVATGLIATNIWYLDIYKNGSSIKSAQHMPASTVQNGHQISLDDKCNGTDYYEVFTFYNTAFTITVGTTFFNGHSTGGPKGDTGAQGAPGPSGSGSGDVLRSGAPSAGQVAVWVDGNAIKGTSVFTGISHTIYSGTAPDFTAAPTFTMTVSASAFTVANPSVDPPWGTYTSITISMTGAGAITWGSKYKGLANYTKSTWVSGTMMDHLTFRWSGTSYDLVGAAKGINQ